MWFRKDEKPADAAPPQTQPEIEDDNGMQPIATVSTTATFEYPKGAHLALLLTALFVSMFLVSLDRMIIATAIPAITDEFKSLPDVGWYGSAYLLTTCSFQLLFGKLYTFFAVKTVWLASIVIFEAGSALCGASPTSTALIVGRAVQGVGGAGIFSGTIVTIVYAVPLEKRPLYQGMFGAVFGLASILGPLIGGAFTSNVTWRWCFYINLPIGAVAFVISAFLLKIPDRDTTQLPLREKLAQLDFLGTFFLVPGVVSLLLALQWGGLTYAWSDGRVVACLVLGIVLFLAFIGVQIFMPKTATIPPRIFKQRSILAGFWATVCVGSQMMIFVYYLPIWFQAIRGASAVESGIDILAMTLSMVVASVVSGIAITRTGYYTPFMIFGSCLASVGSGLLCTLQTDTRAAAWIGYQIIWGLGMGMTFQAPNLAAQTVLKQRDVPLGTALMFFSQLMGGAIFTSVGQNVLNNELLRRLSPLPGFEPSFISDGGATELAGMLPADLLQPVLKGYNEALRTVFHVGLILTCLTVLGAVSMEWRSVKKNVKKPDAEAAAPANEEKSVHDTTNAYAKSDTETAAASDHGAAVPLAASAHSGDLDDEKKRAL